MPSTAPNPALPHSRHRNARGLLILPSARAGAAPPLPAGRDWSPAESALWAEMWGSPQATQWHGSYVSAVAQYVVHACAVVAGGASAWQAQECRHLGDRLGLTPQGLTALGWQLPDPAVGGSSRHRLAGTLSSLDRARARAATEQ